MNHEGLKTEVGHAPCTVRDTCPTASKRVDALIAHPAFVAELRHIVVAFVDLGFGSSAAQLAARPANDNRAMNAVIEDFYCKAA